MLIGIGDAYFFSEKFRWNLNKKLAEICNTFLAKFGPIFRRSNIDF